MSSIIIRGLRSNNRNHFIIYTALLIVCFSLICHPDVYGASKDEQKKKSQQTVTRDKKTVTPTKRVEISGQQIKKGILSEDQSKKKGNITRHKKTVPSKQKAKSSQKQTKKVNRDKISYVARFVPVEEIINYGNNVIGNDVVLTKFLKKLRETEKIKEDKINIIHIGDSHIQSGTLTKVVRLNLQKIFGNAGRGLVCPYSLAKTNGPKDYMIMSNIEWAHQKIIGKSQELGVGICGLTIQTDNPDAKITITINQQDVMDYKFNKINMFHERGPKYTDFILLDSDDNNIGTIEHDCLSTASCNFVSSVIFDHPLDKLKVLTSQKDNTQVYTQIYGVILENGNSGILYHNVGINGATYGDYCKDDFIRQVDLLDPDLIVVSLGTNESFSRKFNEEKFIDNVDRFVTLLKKELPDATIILTVPPDSLKGKDKNWNIPIIRNAIISYCKNNELAYWDLYSVMGGSGSILTWQANKLANSDHVHFLIHGYELQGKLFFDALIKSYNHYASD